ncbi:MAG: hypothetical protein COB24_12920 [Hyphomicrobiales bacterium]|nr:MAG: hypothetical protein COB24_12920 [Hyphomicrobiales bacterium]
MNKLYFVNSFTPEAFSFGGFAESYLAAAELFILNHGATTGRLIDDGRYLTLGVKCDEFTRQVCVSRNFDNTICVVGIDYGDANVVEPYCMNEPHPYFEKARLNSILDFKQSADFAVAVMNSADEFIAR